MTSSPAVSPGDQEAERQGPPPDVPGQPKLPTEVRLEQYEMHSGPLPPARVLREYDEILPGLADRIISMAEREQMHRHHVENVEAEAPFRIARRGQALAIVVVGLVLAFATVLALTGNPITGGVVVGLDLIGLVIVFITGKAPPAGRDDDQRQITTADSEDNS